MLSEVWLLKTDLSTLAPKQPPHNLQITAEVVLRPRINARVFGGILYLIARYVESILIIFLKPLRPMVHGQCLCTCPHLIGHNIMHAAHGIARSTSPGIPLFHSIVQSIVYSSD